MFKNARNIISYRMYAKAYKELKHTKADVRLNNMLIGNQYTLHTANYRITTISYTPFVCNGAYKMKITNKRTKKVMLMTGKVAKSVYFKLYEKFWTSVPQR